MLNPTNAALMRIKQEKPLVLNITNEVTMDFVANGLLSLGASPIMSKAEQEIEDLLKLSKTVVINLGTLDEKFISLCHLTCRIANQLNKPIVLDPVGAGASHYRTATCLSLIKDHRIAIIRGNASEIMALAGSTGLTKGVDSSAQSQEALESAKLLSRRYQGAVVVSGETDLIVDQDREELLKHGSVLMPSITGTGCLLSAVVAAFHAIEADRFQAAVTAALFYSLCGEKAESLAQGPGTFRLHFLDVLYSPL